jgi:hypothetical protein
MNDAVERIALDVHAHQAPQLPPAPQIQAAPPLTPGIPVASLALICCDSIDAKQVIYGRNGHLWRASFAFHRLSGGHLC